MRDGALDREPEAVLAERRAAGAMPVRDIAGRIRKIPPELRRRKINFHGEPVWHRRLAWRLREDPHFLRATHNLAIGLDRNAISAVTAADVKAIDAIAIEPPGADVVTVAVRRTNITDRKTENLLDYLDPKLYKILPNTAGCYTVEDALRYSRLAREAGVSDLIKLEVIGDEKTLFPDVIGLLQATEILAKEGFIVLPYTNDDPIMAKRLVNAGAAAVMPLAAPIGSGLGIRNP